MIRLIANVDIGSKLLTTRSSENVISTVVAPTASGISAATRLRKTSSENSSRIGAASISARWRSASTWSPTWLKPRTAPPTVTPGSLATRAASASAASSSSAAV